MEPAAARAAMRNVPPAAAHRTQTVQDAFQIRSSFKASAPKTFQCCSYQIVLPHKPWPTQPSHCRILEARNTIRWVNSTLKGTSVNRIRSAT
jgi:hypothetical protein